MAFTGISVTAADPINVLGSSARPIAAVCFSLSILGLVGTWYDHLQFMLATDGTSYLSGWFTNAASLSAAVDIIFVLAYFPLFKLVSWRDCAASNSLVLALIHSIRAERGPVKSRPRLLSV